MRQATPQQFGKLVEDLSDAAELLRAIGEEYDAMRVEEVRDRIVDLRDGHRKPPE